MSDQPTLLLIDRDERTVTAFRTAVEAERRVRLVVAGTTEDGLRMAREARPDMIVLAPETPGMNAFAFCQQVRQDATLEGTLLVLEIERGAHDLRLAGLTFGIDEYLTRPIEPAEIQTKLHLLLTHQKTWSELRKDREELRVMRESLEQRFAQLVQLMATMLDMRRPGASDRGKHIADLARKVADRFGVPATHLSDLEVAARLHELGRITAIPDAASGGGNANDDWKYIVATRAIFARVESLAGAAEVVGATFENWDGSGHPDHLQLGQIPLRSRILRVLIDLFAELGKQAKPDMNRAVETLQEHVGTCYDPMVLVHLRAVVQGAADGDVRGKRVVLPVPELRAGMVLAEDLCTEAGLKLLSRNTRLTHETLEVIRRRHASEPITQGAAVLRTST